MNADDTPDDGLGTQTNAASGRARGLNRRSLLKTAAASSPVLLTLASGPVSATECMVASSFVSGATFASRNGNTSVTCVSKGRSYWKSQAANYSSCPPRNSTGHPRWELSRYVKGDCFSGCQSTTISTSTQCWHLFRSNVSSGKDYVLQHMTALKLGNAPFEVATYLDGIWDAYSVSAAATSATGTFTKNGVTWTESQLLTWLQKLLPA